MAKKRPISERLSALVPRFAVLPLLSALLLNCAVYYGARLIAGGFPHFDLTLPWDAAVPFLPWTVLIYVLSYPFWAVSYVLAARFDRQKAARFLCADALGHLICFLFFLLLPTTNVRPAVEGGGFWRAVMRILYTIDAADNLFPSIHCMVSWLCYLGVRDEPRIPRAYRVFSFCFALCVFVSTLTTRQHVLLDVFAGVLLAQLCYLLAQHTALPRLYARLFPRSFPVPDAPDAPDAPNVPDAPDAP